MHIVLFINTNFLYSPRVFQNNTDMVALLPVVSQSGGGKISELLCNKLMCNVPHGVIALQ